MHLYYQLIVDIFVVNMNIERSVSEHAHANIALISLILRLIVNRLFVPNTYNVMIRTQEWKDQSC